MGYRWLSGAMLILLGSGVPGIAQSYPDCPPPASGEYLLLVRGSDAETRDRTISVLPVDKPTLVCNYLDDTVIRAGGFTSLEVANSWALYLNDIEELDTVVVESSTATQQPVVVDSEPSTATQQPVVQQPVVDDSTTSTTATDQEPVTEPVVATAPVADLQAQYQPTLLGEGVAILVDYQQNPEIGRNLAQQGSVGLAVYLQQPYLLVLHTTDSSAAAARLQQLVDSGLTSFLVDGEKVIRLTDTIQ